MEADEVDLGRLDEDIPGEQYPVKWEQWCGLIERGERRTLVMVRLKPKNAEKTSPGPGPIRSQEWADIAKKWLLNTKVTTIDVIKCYQPIVHVGLNGKTFLPPLSALSFSSLGSELNPRI